MAALNSIALILAAKQLSESKPRGRGRPRKHPAKGIHQTLLGERLIIRPDGTIDYKRKRGERKRVVRKYSDADVDRIQELVAARRAQKGITERKALLEILREAADEKWGNQLTPSSKRSKALERLPAIQMLLARHRAKNKP